MRFLVCLFNQLLLSIFHSNILPLLQVFELSIKIFLHLQYLSHWSSRNRELVTQGSLQPNVAFFNALAIGIEAISFTLYIRNFKKINFSITYLHYLFLIKIWLFIIKWYIVYFISIKKRKQLYERIA